MGKRDRGRARHMHRKHRLGGSQDCWHKKASMTKNLLQKNWIVIWLTPWKESSEQSWTTWNIETNSRWLLWTIKKAEYFPTAIITITTSTKTLWRANMIKRLTAIFKEPGEGQLDCSKCYTIQITIVNPEILSGFEAGLNSGRFTSGCLVF